MTVTLRLITTMDYFCLDDGGNEDSQDKNEDAMDGSEAAWIDSDDEKIKVPILVTNKTKLVQNQRCSLHQQIEV
ncbi:CLL_collapsed_G0029340.mRNA.1.CDS.1 [Saccharomyces cerevisiae]|nr:CLL_collapsed_G0029340.mRNA.1.CDS.1 [Saccharomyces cerevisiae]